MARGDSRWGSWQVLLTISMIVMPLSAHGRHALATAHRRHHHRNQSSINKEDFGTRMVISDDSAERDHLIGAGPGLGAGLPVSGASRHRSHKHVQLDFSEDDGPMGEELTAGGAGSDQTSNAMSDDVITVEFHSPAPDTMPMSDVSLGWPKALQPQQQKGADPTAWTLSDFYDYLSPDDDLSALDTTPDPDPSPSPPADMEDENPLMVGSPAVPDNETPDGDGGPLPTSPMPGLDRGQGLGLGGAVGLDGCRLGFVRSGPGVCVSQCDLDPNFCFNGGVCTVVAGMGAFCRCNVQDYIWNKGTRCDWAVTEFQVMCVVVAVASLVLLLLFMIIVFFAKRLHRLKNENKRLRKRSKYRPQSGEPQTDGLSVSTTADGSQPNKPAVSGYTWEYKPRNPYNHYQDEPQKHNDSVKSPPPKEEDSMNIRNSYSPKHENNRPVSADQDDGDTPDNSEENTEDGVTIGLELLLPKEAKLHPETSPPLQYNVFLYKLTNNGDPAPPAQTPPTHTSNAYSSSHPIPKSPKSSNLPRSPKSPKSSKSPKSPKSSKLPKSPKSPKSSNRVQEHLPHNCQPLSNRLSTPSQQPSPSRHHSPSRHTAPGGCSSPNCYSSSHQFSPQYQQPSSSSTQCQLRRPRGRSQAPDSERWGTGRESHEVYLRPSPSSPLLTQPPPSPSDMKYSPVSTRSLPPLP